MINALCEFSKNNPYDEQKNAQEKLPAYEKRFYDFLKEKILKEMPDQELEISLTKTETTREFKYYLSELDGFLHKHFELLQPKEPITLEELQKALQ